MKNYDYANRNPLENRNTYFYSPYIGRSIFIFWQYQRQYSVRKKKRSKHALPSKVSHTDRIISHLQKSLVHKTITSEEWQKIDKFLQRFEVTKRLHGEYNTNWRPVDPDDYKSMETYLLFAELMDKAYQLSTKIQYLNALLKIMDTLTALAKKLDAQQKNRLRILIYREREHIKIISNNIGINYTGPLL